MLTPAISASSTSAPLVIIAKAVSTQVLAPPFLNWWPLSEAITRGLARPFVIAGACAAVAVRAAAAASPAAVPVRTNSRRFIRLDSVSVMSASRFRFPLSRVSPDRTLRTSQVQRSTRQNQHPEHLQHPENPQNR